MPLSVVDHPLAADLLTRLRDKRTGPAEFRSLTRRLGAILVVEATRSLAVTPSEVETPLEPFTGSALAVDLVAIPVLRAGLGLLDAVTDLYPDTIVGYLGMERDEDTHEPRDYYAKLPPLDGAARAGARSDARHRWVRLRRRHVRARRRSRSAITFVCVVAAPEGVARMEADHPDVPIVAGALDRQLNEHAYIVPGLGDFGDRLYGTV